MSELSAFTPIIVYHGTDAQFTQFEFAYTAEQAFFFTPHRRIARTYGSRVIAARLLFHNPYRIPARHWLETDVPTIPQLKAQGHDAIIILPDPGVRGLRTITYAVFNPEQILYVRCLQRFCRGGAGEAPRAQ